MYQRLVLNGEDARRMALSCLSRVRFDDLHEFIVRPFRQPMTSGQRGTLRRRHAEVAAELCARTGHAWTPNDVHRLIFLPKFMPRTEIEIAPGEFVSKPMRTSDLENNQQQMNDSLRAYEAWCYELEIEITVEEG